MLTGELGLGGSEHQLFLFLTHLDRQRFEPHVIVLHPSQHFVFNEALEAQGIRVWTLPGDRRNVPQRSRYIYQLLRLLAPDVVHSWSIYTNPYAGLVGWLARVPVRFGSLRNSLQFEGTRSLPALYRFLALYSISKLVVNAKTIQDELLQRRYPARRIVVLPNCVDFKRLQAGDASPAALTELGIADGQRLVGLIANLRRAKNHALFVHAMARVTETFDDVCGLIIGQPIPSEPDLPGSLQALINEQGLAGRVVLAGFRRDVPELLQRMRIVCLTSHTEGTPNVVLEAMAAGRPVVATRVGGVPELITDGVNGLLVEPGDAEGLARAIVRLLDDPDLAQRLASAGQQMVEQKYGCDRVVRELERLYCDAVAAHRSGEQG